MRMEEWWRCAKWLHMVIRRCKICWEAVYENGGIVEVCKGVAYGWKAVKNILGDCV